MENNQKAFNLPFSENLPTILIGNLSVEPLRAAGIIEEALTQVKDKLTEFIASPTLATDLQTVFGQSTDIPWARTLIEALPVSDQLPQITLVSAELMNGAVGGFDSLTGTVYLADSLIDPNSVITSDTEPSPDLVNVIIEELGHWLDSQLNQVDTPGDEGELLAALVQGDGLSASEIARLRSETDQVVVTLEDQTVILEASGLSFTEDTSISLPGVNLSSVAWADYNGDGKQDFLLTGWDNSSSSISKLYKNTGSGFSEDTSVSLPGVSYSSVAWADYNGDGKQDLLLTGYDGSGYISKLYKNTGSGFIEDTSVSLPGVSGSSVAWADYNGDGKQDFLLTGLDSYSSETKISNKISKLYKNTGSGFIEDTSVSLPGVGWSSVAWADYNGDGKPDLLLTGEDNSYNYISKLYKNTTPNIAQISIKDTQIIEGDNGKKQAKFTVSLNTKVNQKVEVSYATTNGTAKAGEDYQRTNGKLTFKPGETSKTINVPVFGDTKLEANETFKLLLSQPQNAKLGKKQAIGSITNDDLAKISIKDTQIIEGDDGKKQAKFTVSLSSKVNQKVEVSYATSNGTAKVGEDYQRTNGKLTFQPNQTQKTIIVPILGDTLDEDNETFFLNLSKPKNADLGDKRAIGKITNNDTGGDKPGDSFETAVNLGKVKQEISRNDQIGFTEGVIRDADDYYRFQLDRKGTLVLVLDELLKDANIDLYGSSKENRLFQSNEKGISSEIIQQSLDSGTYYVRVYPQNSARTNYRLSIDLI